MILSIDIGHNGAIVLYDADENKVVSFYTIPTLKRQTGMRDVKHRVDGKLVPTGKRVPRMKTEYDVRELIKIAPFHLRRMVSHCLLEDVHAMPFDGGAQLASLMYGKGLYHGIMLANRIPTVFVSPQKWKRGVGIIGKDKKASIKKFIELVHAKKILLCDEFDDVQLWDGLTDAVLMAYYYANKKEE